jgi:hypothetical protein
MDGILTRKLSTLMGLLLILAVGTLPAAAITWGEEDGNRQKKVSLTDC